MPYSTQSKVNAIDWPHDSASTAYLAKNKTALMGVNQPCTLYGVGVKIGVVTDSDQATVTITRRVTIGSETNAVAVATLTIPIGAAAGKIYYKEITPQQMNAGDELKFVFSDHGGSGKWLPWVDAVPREETKANNSDFIASA